MKTTKSVNQSQSLANFNNKVKRNPKKDIIFAPPISKQNQFHVNTKINLQKKTSFSEREKYKLQLRERCKDTIQSIDIIFGEYDSKKVDWKKKFCEIMKDYVDVTNLIPEPLNESGNLLFENFKFWVLFIKFKEETSVININEAISLFNKAYSYEFDNKAYEFLNTFYLNFINSKYSKIDIYNQLLLSKNKFMLPIKPQTVQINHYKYLTDYPEFFVFTEFEKKLSSVDDSSLICSPSNFSSKCSSLNNSMFSTLAGKYPMNFEKIRNQTIYFNPQFNLFSSNHSLNNSLIERERTHRTKSLLKYEDKELIENRVNDFMLEEQADYIRRFDSLTVSNKENFHLKIEENNLVKMENSFYILGKDEIFSMIKEAKKIKINKDIKNEEEIIYQIKKPKNNTEDVIVIQVKRKVNDDIIVIDRKMIEKYIQITKKEVKSVEKQKKHPVFKENTFVGKKRFSNNIIEHTELNYFSVRTRSQARNLQKYSNF